MAVSRLLRVACLADLLSTCIFRHGVVLAGVPVAFCALGLGVASRFVVLMSL